MAHFSTFMTPLSEIDWYPGTTQTEAQRARSADELPDEEECELCSKYGSGACVALGADDEDDHECCHSQRREPTLAELVAERQRATRRPRRKRRRCPLCLCKDCDCNVFGN